MAATASLCQHAHHLHLLCFINFYFFFGVLLLFPLEAETFMLVCVMGIYALSLSRVELDLRKHPLMLKSTTKVALIEIFTTLAVFSQIKPDFRQNN